MEDFKQYLNEDADEQERAAADQVERGLTDLRIEKKLGLVAAERRKLLRLRLLQRVFAGALLLAITGAGYWFFAKKATPSPEAPGSTLPLDKPFDLKGDSLKPQAPAMRQPMAQGPAVPRKQDEPVLRGLSPDQDSATLALVKILLKITRQNDPVYRPAHFDQRYGWGKIVRLLGENKPAAAKQEIFSGDTTANSHASEYQWLLGIALLEEGKPDEALEVFSNIAHDPQHHRNKAAATAVEALR